MQFHLNGFRAGSPEIADPAESARTRQSSDSLPEQVDVLVVGCGPAGLTLAAQLSAFSSISTCIIDVKPEKLTVGQADGIACRSMEMFEAFGFSDRVLKEGYWVNETAFWKPDAGSPENISRSGRIQDTEEGLSEFPHMIINQARVHDFFLDVMRNSPTRLEPDYSRRLKSLQIEAPVVSAEYPVTAQIERTDSAHEGLIETVKARYVVGCDGARSAVRSAIGRSLRGDSANQAWGVMDVLAVTDFPDIRLKALVQSANNGSIVIIPREGGYLVRLYVELDALGENERANSRGLECEDVIAAANRILHPYSIDVKEVAWWSIYEIGQRLCDKFDDVPAEAMGNQTPHVFIAGDACHTHSPKAGQGMNVSMRDSFNLGWKLASVLSGLSTPELLHTYSAERQAVAKELIDFDREWASILSARPAASDDSKQGAEMGEDAAAEFQRYFIKHGRYTAGTAIQYRESMISAQPDWQYLATGFAIGTRFHSAPVIRLGDAKPMELGHTVKADGRWRIFAFAGESTSAMEGLPSSIDALCDFFTEDQQSPVQRFTPSGADIDAVFDVRAVFQQYHRELAIESMPPLLLPAKGRYGLLDYEKAFCADLKEGRDIFDLRGIDRKQGCMVIVRPDQHVANILPLNAYAELTGFFSQFMQDIV